MMPGYNGYIPGAYQAYQPQYAPMGYQQQIPNLLGTQMSLANQVPTQPQAPAPAPTPSNPSTIIWVNGEKDAAMYPIAPNTAVALWDSGNPVIFLKQADSSGKPTMKTFDLVERVESPQNGSNSQGIDMSSYAAKADVAALAGIVSDVRKDIEAIKDEMGNLASQAVKRAVGAKPKVSKEIVPEDEE